MADLRKNSLLISQVHMILRIVCGQLSVKTERAAASEILIQKLEGWILKQTVLMLSETITIRSPCRQEHKKEVASEKSALAPTMLIDRITRLGNLAVWRHVH
jgi:hypothetical protein